MNDCFSFLSSSSPPPAVASTEDSDTPHFSLLLPNLPDDIALQCIARVPPLYHRDLSLVSKSWRSILQSPVFFSTRVRLNCTHHFLYLNLWINGSSFKWFAFDQTPSNPKNHRDLSPIPPVPSQLIGSGSAFASLGPKIYVIGGSENGLGSAPSSSVWILDFRFNRWEIGPKMPVGRKFATAGALNGKIYVMGGLFENSWDGSANWALVFDPVLGSWDPVPSPFEIRNRWVRGTAMMKQKLIVLLDGGVFVFDPCDSSWDYIPTEINLVRNGRASVVDGIVYYCDYLGKIRGFDVEEGKWKNLEGVQKDLPKILNGVTLANVGGKLRVLWQEMDTGKQTEIFCAEVEVHKDSNGDLWGSIVWSQALLVIPESSIVECLEVEF
ncbi:hypothetical protein NE237_018808 [Protea cynaroides]|uniref:F-box domain-containing protein n=1 Tax=Protea cynaroides TaxID=273540 RepID=A0A9Q0QPI2_9MAGN|nr:hypothetical protein NE237_018808 [Protea cynaroides]